MRGDGRIFLRGATYWCAYYLNGKEYRESTSQTDETKAGKFLRNRLKEVGADQLGLRKFVEPKNRRLTVHDLIEALRRDYGLRGKLSSQSASHLDRVDTDFGERLAIMLNAEEIDVYVAARIKAGHAPSSINRTMQLLGQSYKHAIKMGYINQMPPMRHLSEKGNERQGFFSEREFARVVERLPERLRDFARFGFATGMRKKEIKSLRWADVDGDVLKLLGVNAKNGKPRLIPIVGELSRIINRRKAARQFKVNGTVELSPLIFHHKGVPISEFRKSWATACVAAGVGKWVCLKCRKEGTDRNCAACKVPARYHGRIFHDFRRSAVRNMIQAGVSPQVAKKVSGHVTDEIFERYSIIVPDDVRDALTRTEKHRKTASRKVVAMEARP